MNKMVVALRVLTFLQEHTNPIQADIENLRDWVSPEQRDADSDELACIVINAEIEQSKNSRAKRAGQDGV
jgi:hypothetical protein